MMNGSGIHFLMRLLFVSKNIFRQNVPVVDKESIMESAAYIWCRILQELQNSREIAQSEPLWESAEPICAENGVFALYIADREQRSLFLERFFDETERILHDTLNSKLQLELWDDEKTAAFRSDPMVVARINPQYTGENFVVTQENAAAFDAAMRWAEQADAPLLYIYGDRNVGKTHLLHAAARRALQRTPGLELLLRTGDWFFNEMICAIREGDLEARFAEYCNTEMLLMDNVQFAVYPIMANRFLQLLRSRNETGKRTILTADRPPEELLPELAPLIGQVVVLGRNIK